MLIIFTYLQTEKKSINLRLVIEIINLHLNFVLETCLINLTKLIQREMCMMFQLIMVLLIHVTY